MTDLDIPTYEQIETILVKVATNYSSMALVFYDVFYNQTPMDVTFQMYNEAGVLQTYTIPNRAKDMRYILNGDNNPESRVFANAGALYQDIQNGDVYVKKTNNSATGWSLLVSSEDLAKYVIKGTGTPQGHVTGNVGLLYVDGLNAALYIKTTATGNTGWTLISANTSNLAKRDLSNITNSYVVTQKGTTSGTGFQAWYRRSNDGWCEQWGIADYGSSPLVITFPRTFSSMNFVAIVSTDGGYANVSEKYNNGIRVTNSVNNVKINWMASGFSQ